MEKTLEKSQEQADIIRMIVLPILMLDVDYCKELAGDMIQQAHRQESIAVLNPSHPQIKNDILRTQGIALKKLCEYVDTLKEVDALKQKLSDEQKISDDISKLFL